MNKILISLFLAILLPYAVFATGIRGNCDYESDKIEILQNVQTSLNQIDETENWKVSTEQDSMGWDCTESGLTIFNLLIELPIESSVGITYLLEFNGQVYNPEDFKLEHELNSINIEALSALIQSAEEQIQIYTFAEYFEEVDARISIQYWSEMLNKNIGEEKIIFSAESIEENRKSDYRLEFFIDPENNVPTVYQKSSLPHELEATGLFDYEYPSPSLSNLDNHNKELSQALSDTFLVIGGIVTLFLVTLALLSYFVIRKLIKK